MTDDAFTTTIISIESNVSIMSNSNYIGDDYVHTISTTIDLKDTIVLTDVSTVENERRNYRINSHNIFMQTKANAVNDLPCEQVNNDNIINLTPNNNEENYDALTANETSTKILCNYRAKEKLIIDGHKWPKNAILIAGDSILNNIQENRLNKKFNVKVRPFPGACISDMYFSVTKKRTFS